MKTSEIKESSVHINNMDMSYLCCGSGPDLVLLHGGLLNGKGNWGAYLSDLSEYFTVYAPDSRGHGKTTNPEEIWSYEQMADDLVAFIDALELEKPYICGYSDGAQVALAHAVRGLDTAAGYILGAVTPEVTETYKQALGYLGMSESGEVDFDTLETNWAHMIGGLVHMHSAQGEDYWKTVVSGCAKLFFNINIYNSEKLESIKDKVLIVLGDRDQLISVESVVKLYRSIPTAYLAIAPDSSHYLYEESVEWFLSAIKNFCV